ncbi:DNA translocase FtsK [Shinella zoogloeoides]|uniref:DNA translocase FtsK n=1 Tax=Shinella zoogloeoides TaxID=352475 RepID=UPI003C79160A
MRISRTNFYPVLETEGENDDASSHYPYENNAVTDTPPEEEAWHGESEPVANDDHYRPRFRSPALRSYDPGQYADGTWESHFYLAPNVRFTRTPDKVAARIEEAAAEEVTKAEPIIEEPVQPAPTEMQAETSQVQQSPVPQFPVSQSQNPQPEAAPAPQPQPQLTQAELLLRLREALEERRRRFEEQQAPATVAAADPVPQFVQAVIAARQNAVPADAAVVYKPAVPAQAPVFTPARPAAKASVQEAVSRFAHLSDHAFWETMVPEESVSIAPARPAVSVVRMTLPTPAPVATMPARPVETPREEPVSVASLYRVVDCRPAVTRQVTVETVAVPEIKAEPVVAEAAPVIETVEAVPAPVEARPAPVAVTPAAVVEPVREAPSSVLSRARPFQVTLATPTADTYEYPPRDLLQEPPRTVGFVLTQEQLEQNAGLLESVLEDFGVRGEIIHVRPGPVVTLYEFEPAPGVKSSRVIGLADDIARSMSALSARVAVVPGRNVIGIELPNATRETVYFREMIDSADFAKTGFKLPICLGKTIGGEPVIAELAKMPHLLVAGTTGSGKSVAINTMILSLLYRFRPEECRLIMVDPKMLELSIYDGIPHLLTPVVTDPKKAVMALKWAVREMEDRYRKMSRLGVRNIDGYNNRVAAARDKGETITISVQTGFDKGTGEAINEDQELSLEPMPYIVVIVDEMADLMMVAGKEIEGAIQRLAQMARAAGIHLIMATQRPSVDVITGTIKANFPTRISFQVTSKIDSRTILGEQGAEQLLGQGDMLHMAGGGRISRVHGPFVSDEEVEKVVLHLKAQGRPEYLETVTADEEEEEDEKPAAGGAVFDKGDIAAEDGDDLYEKAVKVVMRDRKCSTSYIQRRLAVGYNRAASLVERMEKEGLVGPANHVGKREIVTGERNGFQQPESGDDE